MEEGQPERHRKIIEKKQNERKHREKNRSRKRKKKKNDIVRIAGRKIPLRVNIAENAENYMQSLLNYAGLLCKYGAMDELASLYQEINTICDEINAQYPDAYGMLRPKGNRVNFGYVFQRASMRTK